MEMYVSVGFIFDDRALQERVTKALDLFNMNSGQDYSMIPDKIKEFESRMSALLGDVQIFDDRGYYEYLEGLEELKVNKSGSVRLRLTTGALGREFASSLKRLLQRLGAKKLTVRVTSDADDDDEGE